MSENIMCSNQKANSKEFNDNYDHIFPEEHKTREIDRLVDKYMKEKEKSCT